MNVGKLTSALLAILTSACLPEETRTAPGLLEVSVVASPRLDTGAPFETEDGWALWLDPMLISLGELELSGDDCDPYSDGGYQRILSIGGPEPQRLSQTYALGTCELSFAVAGPGWNTVLGQDVPAQIALLFRSPGSDGERQGGVAFLVEGRAERDGERKTFSWAFRPHLQFETCRLHTDHDDPQPLTLASGKRSEFTLEVDPTQLFRQDGSSDVAFAPFAVADDETSGADGTIALVELAATTLFDEVYYDRLPRLIRLAGGICTGRLEGPSDSTQDH
jgi:hypothetical protein